MIKVEYFEDNKFSGIYLESFLDDLVIPHIENLHKYLNCNSLVITTENKERFKFSLEKLKEKTLNNRLLSFFDLIYDKKKK